MLKPTLVVLLLLLIHWLGWFVGSVAFAVVRGDWDAVRPRAALAMGSASWVLHLLIKLYLFEVS